MFTSAVGMAAQFTFPYVGLRRTPAGSVSSIVASFVMLSREGWFVTSAHVIDEIVALENESDIPHSEVWAIPGFATLRPRLTWARVHRPADIAIGRIEPVDPDSFTRLPLLRDTEAAPLVQGAAVCRLGFPFYGVAATFDEASGDFAIADGAFPIPRFALDGIVSRFNRRAAPDGSVGVFVETSTPGLRGQSGGPLLDVDGRLCGIQSHTEHLDLGFDARYLGADGVEVVERQFLNVGAATHVDEVRSLLDSEGIPYEVG